MFNFSLFKKYKLVHMRDQAILDLVRPNLETGPWIAGGSVLRWIDKRPVGFHDIDIFVRDQEQFDVVCKQLTDNHFIQKFSTSNAISYSTAAYAQQKVQVIKFFFSSAEELIRKFDFTICGIATDGNKVITVPEFKHDRENKILRLQGHLREDALKRIIKYMCYGYTPNEELLDTAYNKTDLINRYTDSEQYDFGKI